MTKLKQRPIIRQLIIIGLIIITSTALIIMSPNPIMVKSNAEYDYWASDATIEFESYNVDEDEYVQPIDSDNDIEQQERSSSTDLVDEKYSGNLKVEARPLGSSADTNSSNSAAIDTDSNDDSPSTSNPNNSSKISSSKASSSKTSSSKPTSSKSSSSNSSSKKPTSSKVTSSKVTSSKTTSSKKPTSSKPPASSAEPPYTGMVSLNKGTFEQLCSLDGIGEVIAQRIIDFRNDSGGFTDIEEIKYVKGIGEAKFAAIVDRLTL